MVIADNCCTCNTAFDPVKCYSISGAKRKYFAGTTHNPNHWSSPFLGAYRVVAEAVLPALPTGTFNTGGSFEILIAANAHTDIAAGSELGTLPLCRLTGNIPSGLVIAEGETTSGWDGRRYWGGGTSYVGGDASSEAGGVITHHQSVIRVAGWNGVNYNTGALLPVRNRTLLMLPRNFAPSGEKWAYFWKAVVTRHYEANHLYGYTDLGAEIRGDYYWTTVTFTDELIKYPATLDQTGWAYTYKGVAGTDEDPDLRSTILKPEDEEVLALYDPTLMGSVAQSPTTIIASLPRYTTVATSIRATLSVVRTIRHDTGGGGCTVPATDTNCEYYVVVNSDTGARSFTGNPYMTIDQLMVWELGGVWYENKYGASVNRVWPFLDIVKWVRAVVGDTTSPAVLLCMTNVSNTLFTQEVTYTLYFRNGTEVSFRVSLDWLGVQNAYDFVGNPWGANAVACYEDGLCDRMVLIVPGPPPLYQRRIDCATPCFVASFGAVFLPYLSHTMIDWGWKITLLGQCPDVPPPGTPES